MFLALQILVARTVCGPFPGAQPQGGPLNSFRLPQLLGCVSLKSRPPNSHGFEGRGPLTGGLLEAAQIPGDSAQVP